MTECGDPLRTGGSAFLHSHCPLMSPNVPVLLFHRIRRFAARGLLGVFLMGAGGVFLPAVSGATESVADVGSRRELFVEDALIERLVGGAQLRLHAPVPREVVLVRDAPWEGAGSGYTSVFRDGSRYRMYYKAWQRTPGPGVPNTDGNPLLCAYAESDDGIHWRKPELGLHAFNGSTANNIVIASGVIGDFEIDAGHPAVFKDGNPAAPADARYKAVVVAKPVAGRTGPRGLMFLKSPDGLRWSPLSSQPVITDGAFDSQNLAFWDAEQQVYRAYWRYFDRGTSDQPFVGLRSIRTAISHDLIHWEQQANLTFGSAPQVQLYTNQVLPYPRAPHLLLGMPMRYIDRGWSEEMRALPDREHREWRAAQNQRLGTALTDAFLIASRDGVAFKRWPEAFLRPGPERTGTWSYGQQCVAWQIVTTAGDTPGAPDELSLYADESYWSGAPGSSVRRYTLRLDGFVSVHAPESGGELVTRPIRFTGRQLSLNVSTSAAGSVQVELQDAEGHPLPGFTLAESEALFGDSPDRLVRWRGVGHDVSSLVGRRIRVRFVLSDADVYSYQFQP